MLEILRLKFQWNWATPRRFTWKVLGEQSCKNKLFKTIYLNVYIRLQFNQTQRRIFYHQNIVEKVYVNNMEFSTIKITLEKVSGNNVGFWTSKIIPRKVHGNNVDFSTIKITSKKVRGNDMYFSISEITSKKNKKMTWKFVEIWYSPYRWNIGVE